MTNDMVIADTFIQTYLHNKTRVVHVAFKKIIGFFDCRKTETPVMHIN